MSGGELLRSNRAEPRFAAIPVVVVSAWMHEAAQLGELAQAYIRKPVALVSLLDTAAPFCRRE